MAPLRSSRSTRNHDHQAAARSRGVVDLDPTEGLPVQKWEQVTIRVNQESAADPNAITSGNAGMSTTSSAEWAAQFNTPQYPYPELPLPSFFSQLSQMNQELLRRSRCPNTKPTLSEWDRKANEWASGADIERKQHALKEEHVKPNENTSTNQDLQHQTGDHVEHEEDEDREDRADEDTEMDQEDETSAAVIAAPPAKRRRHLAPEERTFEVKRWTQVPIDVAEKTEERKFLADRRTGMPSLYGGSYQNQVFQPLGLSQFGYTAYGTSNASYDLGDGSGLGTAVTQDQPAAPPVRRNMPPKRKKKKGGPGRKKANPVSADNAGPCTSATNGTDGEIDATNTAVAGGEGTAGGGQEVAMQDVDEEGSESGDSEGEGSEEGEIEDAKQVDEVMSIAPGAGATDSQAQEVVESEVATAAPPEVRLEEASWSAAPATLQEVSSQPQPPPEQVETAGVVVAPIEPGPLQEAMAGTTSEEPGVLETAPDPEPILPDAVADVAPENTVAAEEALVPGVHHAPITAGLDVGSEPTTGPEPTQASTADGTGEILAAPSPVQANAALALPSSVPEAEPVAGEEVTGSPGGAAEPDLLGSLEDHLDRDMAGQ